MESAKPNSSQGVVLIVLIVVIVALVLYIERDNSSTKVAEALTLEMEQKSEIKGSEPQSQPKSDTTSYQMREFDPNTVELLELLNMGLTKQQALSLLRYRESGKVFNIKEEVIACYGFSDSLYFALEPYIVIGEEFQYKRREYRRDTTTTTTTTTSHTQYRPEIKVERELLSPTPFLIDTVGVEYLHAIGALSVRQAQVFVKWRDMSGIENEEELRACYVVSDSVATVLMNYAIFTPKTTKREVAPQPKLIDLNNADSAALRSVYGIGEKSVVAIMQYRDLLGGFYSMEQLRELNVILDHNYKKIITQIFVDSCDISKIDVNFALAKELGSHPYIAPKLRRLLNKRELKGGWSSIEEMIDDKIFSQKEAQRVRPYLSFELPDLN